MLSSASDKVKLFTKNFAMLVFFINISLTDCVYMYVVFFCLFSSNTPLQVVLDRKSSQENPVNAGVPQGSLVSHIND